MPTYFEIELNKLEVTVGIDGVSFDPVARLRYLDPDIERRLSDAIQVAVVDELDRVLNTIPGQHDRVRPGDEDFVSVTVRVCEEPRPRPLAVKGLHTVPF